eukprot:Gb_15616 [translate_table: standard]
MDALKGPVIGHGALVCSPCQTRFALCGLGSFKMRGRHRIPYQQKTSIAKISKVYVVSTLARNSVIFAEHSRHVATRRRNSLRPKILETLKKPTIANNNEISDDSEPNIEDAAGRELAAKDEYDAISMVDFGNQEPNIGEIIALDVAAEEEYNNNSKVEIENLEPDLNKSCIDDNSIVETGNSEPNVNEFQSFTDDNTEVDIGSLESNVNEAQNFTDEKSKLDIDSQKLNANEVESFTDIEKDTSQNDTVQVQEVNTGGGDSSIIAQGAKMWDSWKNWHAQYHKDIRVWGVGRAPIFVVDLSDGGEVHKVSINENEISNRCGARPFLADYPDDATISHFNAKVAQAKLLARDIEIGAYKPPRNSTIFEFVNPAKNGFEKWGVLGSVFCRASSVIGPAPPLLKISLVGLVIISGSCFVWAAQRYMFHKAQSMGETIDKEKQKVKINEMNSEMEKEKEDSRVSALNLPNAKATNEQAEVRRAVLTTKSSIKGKPPMDEAEFQEKVLEIQAMARQARMIEHQSSQVPSDQHGNDHSSNFSTIGENTGDRRQQEGYLSNLSIGGRNGNDSRYPNASESNAVSTDTKITISQEVNEHSQKFTPLSGQVIFNNPSHANGGNSSIPPTENQQNEREVNINEQLEFDVFQDGQNPTGGAAESARKEAMHGGQERKPFDQKDGAHSKRVAGFSSKVLRRVKPRLTTSPKEARRVSASKHGKTADSRSDEKESALKGTDRRLLVDDHDEKQKVMVKDFNVTLNPRKKVSITVDSLVANKNTALNKKVSSKRSTVVDKYERLRPSVRKTENESEAKVAAGKALENMSYPNSQTPLESAVDKVKMDHKNESGAGLQIEPQNVAHDGNNALAQEAEEFEWMRDEVLQKIVFKVQANEKAEREPLYGLVSEEELLFFRGLERKFEREGESVKEWITEKVKNLKYGKDGAGPDDLPEDFIARLNNSNKTSRSSIPDKYDEDHKKLISEKMGIDSSTVPKAECLSVNAKPISASASSTIPSINSSSGAIDAAAVSSKSVISSSGKSSQIENHSERDSSSTKNGSCDFHEKYNKETEPEMTALLRNTEQSMERWTTKGEVEEASKFLSEHSKGKLEHYERIKSKLKKESEMSRREAKLNEDSESKREVQDHLWWLDLSYVLCIGLYRNYEGDVLRGLYTLEMAPDLELASKPCHTIAFQDRGDATNFCYILQSHFKELENSSAHVIPRSAKEFYEEAKLRAFKVTVIKKGQLQLYVGQPLKEVERRIVEIGSTIYYDRNLEDHVIP